MQTYNQYIVTKNKPNFQDFITLGIFLSILLIITKGFHLMSESLNLLENLVISLSPIELPKYALCTVLRMFCAMFFSILFAIIYGTIAAKSKYAEKVLIPVLDIFQSIPVLGYISFTVTGFVALFPGSSLGLEFASIFAAFTNQVPNMTFSFYQSLKTIPDELNETCTVFKFSTVQKFFSLELPFAIPGLIWNGMMSMSGSWFLIVASEAITLNHKTILLPGIGSYIAQAIIEHDLNAIGYAVLCMLIVIFLYDQIMFRPLIAWGDKFHAATNENTPIPQSFMLNLLRKSQLFYLITNLIITIFKPILKTLSYLTTLLTNISHYTYKQKFPAIVKKYSNKIIIVNYALVFALLMYGAYLCFNFITSTIGWEESFLVIKLGFYTMLRVITMIVLAAIIWVPVGVYIGLRPALAEKIEPLAQFLAAFPANLIFPLAVILITRYQLNPNIWLSPLMILGTQWYILFNVIAGTSAFSKDLIYTADIFAIKGRFWWQKIILPGIFPYLITGTITAAGGAWNASIIAEVVTWGDTHIIAQGIGAYITQATGSEDFPRIIIGIVIMSIYVITLNNLVWRPLYNLAAQKAKLG